MPEGFFKATFGMRNQQIIPMCFDFVNADDHAEIARLGNRKEELYREILRRDGIEPLPGVVALLAELKELGKPTAVRTTTPRLNIETIMAMTGLAPYFQAIVSAEDVTVGKPDPQVFLKAGEKIGCPPERCLVFEDAHVGIEAGKRAGMKVLAVATTHPLESLHQADAAFVNLSGLTVETILAAVSLS
jgi:HAD superfamily hydrolase (TIGR01509 family)